MATKTGHKIENKYASPAQMPLAEAEKYCIVELLFGPGIKTLSQSFTRNLVGSYPDETWDTIADNKIYLYPTEIDAGLIGSAQYYTLEIWNASEDVFYITLIEQTNPSGITLDVPSTPIMLTGETVYLFDLTIEQAGPAIQSTTITFYFSNGDVRELVITGRRIESFPYSCNAVNGVKMSYKYETVIASSYKFVEQRRAILDIPRRKMEVQFWFESTQAQQCLNQLKAFNDKILAIPAYMEELLTTTYPLLGQSEIYFSNSLSTCYNMDRSTLVLIYDEEMPQLYELKEIASVDKVNNKITLQSSILKSFREDTTRIFPVILCFCPEFPKKIVTDTITEFSLSFEEYA